MFMLGREKAKDEFDVLLSEGKSFQEVRRLMKERERARRDGVVKDEADRYAAMFQTSSAGVTKEAMLASNRGGPLALSEVKNLSAISLQRLPESKQPLDLLKRPLTDMELMEIAVRRCYVTGILDLKNCHLTEIPGKAMNTMMVQFGNITSINLNSNLLTTIPHSFAPLCPRLTELSVCGNKLKDVPRSILYLPRITELNLSENRIENVDILQAPLMEVLRFSNNYISSLDNMSYLRKLHTLHLDYCHMSFLTAHMKKLKALTYLDLSHNTLVSLALPSREATASKAQKKDGKGSGAVQSAEAKIGDTRVWQEVFDPFTGRKSYYCRQTKEARRTKPPGFDIQQAALAEKHRLQKEAVDRKAATLALAPVEIPEHLKDSASLPLMRSESSTLKEPPKVDPWMELVDDETGYTYFYNSWTGETAWEKPDPDNVVVKLKGWELVVDETSSDGAVYYRDLATNITQWEMPPEMDTLDALENLMTLNVGNNRLGALAPKLNLSWNAISGFPKEMYFMHWLKRLTVDNNRITEFTEDIGVMQGLETFWFGMNLLERLPFTFGKLKNLKDVMFLSNPYVFPAVEEFAKGTEHILWLCRQEGLKYFRGPPPVQTVIHYGVAEEGCLYESEFLKNLKEKLKTAEETGFLNLNFANMPKISRHTFEPLWKLTGLKDLRLVDNGFKKFPIQFLRFTALTNLVLRRNKLIELPDNMDEFPGLTGLHLEGNVLTELPPTFATLTNLTELTLAANRFTVLPDYVTTFTKLKRLVVDTNFYEKLPEGIGQLQQLSFLCCSRNRITHLPESIVKLTKLKTLSVYQNRLGDRGIPDCICDMGNLRELQLSYNSISRLPYRFTTGSIMSSLRRLWLFGNCFFDVGDLPIRLKAVRDLRLDNNPLKSPPVRYTAGQIPALLEYTSTRISRIREVQRRCEAEGWVVEPTRLVPTVARDGHLVISGYGTLNEEELTAFDQVVEQYINGDIYACNINLKEVIDNMVAIHKKRWFKYVRKVVLDFQDFIQFLFFNNLISDEYITTSLTRPWGRNGEEIECYGLDLDALYVNTGFRVAILDTLRGPDRTKVRSVCRYAEPVEFMPKKVKKQFLSFLSRKASKRRAESEEASAVLALPAEGEEDYVHRAESNPRGNWLWQLATELVPKEGDVTDVLTPDLPPPHNKYRNPKCHPDVKPHEEVSAVNARRERVGLPPVPEPNSGVERAKRLAGRRGAIPLNTMFKFNVPRSELELILREYQGPFGPVAEREEEISFYDCPHPKYEAYALGEPVPDFIHPLPAMDQDDAEAARKRRGKAKKKKKKKRRAKDANEEPDRSDSEEEEDRIALFWEGKHRPCVRPGWIVSKWTFTKKEAKRQEEEDEEIYDLVVRLRELIDESLHTAEGQARLQKEVARRQQHARDELKKAEEKLLETQKVLIEVRQQQLNVGERARRFRAGWDFEEHRFKNEHEIDKALRRAQLEMNDWEAFVDTELARVERRRARTAMTPEQWEMNAIASLQRVQNKRAKDMIFEKNRRIAYAQNWRRPWDGRGGARFAKWKAARDRERLYATQHEMRKGDGFDTESEGEEGPASRAALRKPKTAVYDIAGTFSDARTRDFPFGPDTDSEDEQDRQERENLDLSSEEEFRGSDGETVGGGAGGPGARSRVATGTDVDAGSEAATDSSEEGEGEDEEFFE